MFIDVNDQETYAKDGLGVSLKTKTGSDKVISVYPTNRRVNMYDLSLSENSNHLYYGNGVLSHNTTCSHIWWYKLPTPFGVLTMITLVPFADDTTG